MDAVFRPSGSENGGISQNLWRTCRRSAIMANNGLGYYVEDNFTRTRTFASATPFDGYTTYQDTGVTISPLASSAGGGLSIAGADANNDEGSIQVTTVPFILSTTTPRKLWFEARVRATTVADQSFFVGLAPSASAVADILADSTGALKNQAMLGFSVLAGAPTAVDAVYKLSSTLTTVKAAAATIAAATFVNLGFYFDGTKLYYYVNGVQLPGVNGIPLGGATFPDDTYMSPLFAFKKGANSSTDEKGAAIKWWSCFQEA